MDVTLHKSEMKKDVCYKLIKKKTKFCFVWLALPLHGPLPILVISCISCGHLSPVVLTLRVSTEVRIPESALHQNQRDHPGRGFSVVLSTHS